MRPYRKEKVASVVRNIVSDAIAHRLQDPRLCSSITVTRVEMTGDLQIARVFLSTPGDERQERKTMTAMRHAAGYIQRLVARELSIRHCPELRFAIDEAAKSARKTMELLEENRRKNPELFEPETIVEGDGADKPGQPDELDRASTESQDGGEA